MEPITCPVQPAHAHRPKTAQVVQVSHGTHYHHRPVEQKRLKLALWLIGLTMIGECVGGFLTNSLALISDAGHMFTHFFALGVSFFAIRLASKKTGKEKSFGLYRVEVLAALFNGITLVAITAYIFIEGATRILHPQPVAELPMLGIAFVGLLVNLGSAVILWGASREDLNVRSAFLHMLGDTASSVGIVAAAIIISFTDWYVLDPIASILIGAVILIWAGRLLWDSVYVLLEATPRKINVDEVIVSLAEVEGVKTIHDVHIWEITSKMYSLTAHVVIDDLRVSESQKIADRLSRLADQRFDICHTNFQFETFSRTR